MSEHTTSTAVTFDVAAFRTWLDTTETITTDRPIAETDMHLSSGYSSTDGDAGWLTAGVLLTARNAENAGWSMATGTDVRVHVLADTEGDDDGVYLEVLADGQWLGAGHLTRRELIPVDKDQRLPGYEAAIIALENLARAVNERVKNFREKLHGPYAGQLTRYEIEVALAALAEYHDGGGVKALTDLQKQVASKVGALTLDDDEDDNADGGFATAVVDTYNGNLRITETTGNFTAPADLDADHPASPHHY